MYLVYPYERVNIFFTVLDTNNTTHNDTTKLNFF